MNKIYIATRLHNAKRAQQLKARLESLGYEITYDWTTHNQVYNEEELQKVGTKEEDGVRRANLLLLILPGGCGSHWEAGLARGLGTPIVILMEATVEKKSFYYLNDNIYRTTTEDEAIAQITTILGQRTST